MSDWMVNLLFFVVGFFGGFFWYVGWMDGRMDGMHSHFFFFFSLLSLGLLYPHLQYGR